MQAPARVFGCHCSASCPGALLGLRPRPHLPAARWPHVAACRVWDIRTKVQVHCLSGHEDTVASILAMPTEPQARGRLHTSAACGLHQALLGCAAHATRAALALLMPTRRAHLDTGLLCSPCAGHHRQPRQDGAAVGPAHGQDARHADPPQKGAWLCGGPARACRTVRPAVIELPHSPCFASCLQTVRALCASPTEHTFASGALAQPNLRPTFLQSFCRFVTLCSCLAVLQVPRIT